MSLFRRGDVWWYEFWFAGRRLQESSKSPSKTVAKNAEQKRRRELEEGFNNLTDTRHERVRTFSDVADEFFNGYKLRLPTRQYLPSMQLCNRPLETVARKQDAGGF